MPDAVLRYIIRLKVHNQSLKSLKERMPNAVRILRL
jgi:hypothetical protein